MKLKKESFTLINLLPYKDQTLFATFLLYKKVFNKNEYRDQCFFHNTLLQN